MSNDVRGDEGGGDVEEQVWGKEWMLRGPARSGEDEEKTLPGRVAAGDFLSHTHTHTGRCEETKFGCVCARHGLGV